MRRRLLLLAIGCTAIGAAAMAPRLVIEAPGPTQTPIGDLSTLPVTHFVAAYAGHATVAYDGPLLWAILERAHLPPGDMRAHAGHTVTVIGADGYGAVLAMAEIDPGLEGKPVMLATTADGRALPLPRLVVPGDHAPARSVRDVVRIKLD